MPASQHPMSRVVIETVIKGLEESRNSIDGLQKHVHAVELKLKDHEISMEGVRKDIKQLLRAVDGERLSRMELELIAIKEQKTQRKEESKYKWQLWTAVIVAALSLIGNVSNAIIGKDEPKDEQKSVPTETARDTKTP